MLDITEFEAEGPWENTCGAGVGSELGYEYKMVEVDGETHHELFIWHYDHVEADGYNNRAGNYVFRIQQQFEDGTWIQFEQPVVVANISGAVQFAYASMAAAASLYALI